MANMELLMRSISFIEDHLDDEMQTEDIAKACAIEQKIIAMNGNTFDFEDKKIPLKLHTAITQLDYKVLKYEDLFSKLYKTIRSVAEKSPDYYK